MLLQKNDLVLFLGDSITDAGRKVDPTCNGGMGPGYAGMVAATLAAGYPELNLSFRNAGVGGNRVSDLEPRLEGDVLAFRPNLVSLLIGVNDTWRKFDSGLDSPIEEFHACYRRILRALTDRLDARLVLMEPFLLCVREELRALRADLDGRIQVVRELAREFRAALVPLDALFAQAACRQAMTYWLGDGFHPTPAGHALITEHWIRAVTR
jgi:acyl-CoA thioesterase I